MTALVFSKCRANFQSGTVYDLDDRNRAFLDTFSAAEELGYMFPDLENTQDSHLVLLSREPLESTNERKYHLVDTERRDASFCRRFCSFTSSGQILSVADEQTPCDCSDEPMGNIATRVKHEEIW